MVASGTTHAVVGGLDFSSVLQAALDAADAAIVPGGQKHPTSVPDASHDRARPRGQVLVFASS
jgi:hypothetical protein